MYGGFLGNCDLFKDIISGGAIVRRWLKNSVPTNAKQDLRGSEVRERNPVLVPTLERERERIWVNFQK